MPIRPSVPAGLGILCLLLGFGSTASADTEIRIVTRGTSSLTISGQHLEPLGLAVSDLTGAKHDRVTASETRYSFPLLVDTGVSFRTRDLAFAGFRSDDVTIAHRGGFLLEARDSRLRGPVARVDLLGFSFEPASGDGIVARIRGSDGTVPLEIRNTGFGYEASTGDLVVPGGDLVIAADWARAVGRPELAGRAVGAFELRLGSKLLRREALDVVDREPSSQAILDVLLNEVYGMMVYGRIGTYPTGTLGLSFATTSCNNGTVDVPWHAPMAEDHPFIGLAMWRESNGRVEQIGRSWLKHGFFALANDQCDLGCAGGGGGYLIVACSDTYSAANNASQFYLGPREEVNPHTCVWNCLGSWFDGTPVDCIRDETGSGLGPTEHRLEVLESDLLTPGAKYYYEGVYYVMDDDVLFNNFGWRECTVSWNGSWSFSDVGGGLLANPGPYLFNWGQEQRHEQVAPDDGYVILAEDVTELGGGTWHYEYVLYNQTSGRAIEAFSVPVYDAVVTNAGFRDIDQDADNDWAFSVAPGAATWETTPFGDPGTSNPLEYQSSYNFWFDANSAPTPESALLTLHRPGVGTHVLIDVSAPGGVTGVVAADRRAGLTLFPSEPNPFVTSTRVAFSLERAQEVKLYVTDVGGRVVRTLVDGAAPSGRSAVHWDGRDDTGRPAASGIYFFRLESAAGSRTTKGILLR